MSDKTLRAKLVRLAYTRPELRTKILPLLGTPKQAAPKDKKEDSTFKEQMEKANKLDQVDPAVAKLMSDSGLRDGGPAADDKISVAAASVDASALKPSQTTMVLDKAVGMALLMLKTGKVGGQLGAMISSDNFIMDGHHRWAATILAGGGNVGGYKANLKGPVLLRVLNIISKGMFHVTGGNPGKGSIKDFTPKKVEDLVLDLAKNGIPGDHPWTSEQVSDLLTEKFGSVEKGAKQMGDNVKSMTTKVPSWAPDRKQMPVINENQVDDAAKAMSSGEVDWHAPFKEAALRKQLVRLAYQKPELRADLLPLLKKAASMEVGKVYMLTKPASDMEGVWFKAESEQKNGGMKGQGVEWWSGKKNPDKPKQYSVQKANYNLWKPATDVPSEVKLAKTSSF